MHPESLNLYEHRHSETTSIREAEALAAAANNLLGFKVVPLADAGEQTVHFDDGLQARPSRTSRVTVPEGQRQIGIIAENRDTDLLYQEAERIMGDRQ